MACLTHRNKKDIMHQNCKIAFGLLVLELVIVAILAFTVSLSKLLEIEGGSSSSYVATVTGKTRVACMTRSDLESFHDIKFLRLVGSGTVNYGFEAILGDQVVIAKITGDDLIFWSDIEIDLFDILNEPPTIPNIPELLVGIRSMPNPFTHHDAAFLEKNLSVPVEDVETIIAYRRISVVVMKFLPKSERPRTLKSVHIFVKSMLETLAFAHSRGVMNCDVHGSNYHFDGRSVSLYDWNAGYLYQKDVVPMIYEKAPMHLMPPEAKVNASAVHATVSAFDIYSIGRLLNILLKGCCNDETNFETGTSTFHEGDDSNENEIYQKANGEKHVTGDPKTCSQMYNLVDLMLTSDPYQRPNATQLLQHPVFDNHVEYRETSNDGRKRFLKQYIKHY